MSTAGTETKPGDSAVELEGSTYEIIRNRLQGFGDELRSRLGELNAARKDVFGSIETRLTGTERITTDNNCVPRDMVAVGHQFIFGYNVHLGLKTEMDLSDVFSLYEFSDGTFHELTLDLIHDARFEKDFKDVYRYYKNAVFARFFTRGPHLFMVFQVGKTASDIKTFKWLIDGESLRYLDNRSDHEVTAPPQHEFEWQRTTRDMHVTGEHPHISIEDRVFVETVGGDLTVKIEDNTDSGEGIYAEPVDIADQTLDDADIAYAIVGNIILLKIQPYQERAYRFLAYNEKIQQCRRLDSIEHACVLLPDDHGLIFSNGYYLQSGEHKTFDSALSGMKFDRQIAAPNGEDYLYIFHNDESGTYILLRYNLIEQQVDTPIICHGFTLFSGGELICFRAQDQPQKHHAIQVWQTPYVGEDFVPHTNTDSYLYKVGNRDIVRGMAECHEILTLIDKEDTYADLYVDLVKLTTDICDAYFWIGHDETFNLKDPLSHIRDAAASAVDEFEKVVRVKKATADQTRDVSRRTNDIVQEIHRRRFDHINDFVASLGDLRRVRGDIISLRDLRYIDPELVDRLEAEVSEHAEKLAQKCVSFLLKPDSLVPYEQGVTAEADKIAGLTKVSDAKQVGEDIAASASELEMLIEIVSNLKIDDATHRTTIIDNISGIFATVNQARASLKQKIKELMSVEGVAEFNSQMKLLNQAVVNYLDICDTPDKCEEFLTKVMIQIEELEGRFAEFDEFVVQLTDKREEIYNAFETRKLSLVEARNKRATALMNAAERILKGIRTRVDSFDSVNEINGYFASDLMIEKVRDIIGQLGELDDSVKVDDIQSRLKTVREDAVRQLKDRQELFVGGDNVIRFGKHQFSVNVQALDLTTVLRDGAMMLHLTGTKFFEPIADEELLSMRDLWEQEVVSENGTVYRGEYLAYCLLEDLQQNEESPSIDEAVLYNEQQLLALVQRFMGPRYTEAYSKGVHDGDAAKILQAMLEMKTSIGLLRFHTRSRALARIFWEHFGDEYRKELMAARLAGFGTVTQLFPNAGAQREYIGELRRMLTRFVEETGLFPVTLVDEAAEYLFHELASGGTLCVSRVAAELYDAFYRHLRSSSFEPRFTASLRAVEHDAASRFQLAKDWAEAFMNSRDDEAEVGDEADFLDEVAAILSAGDLNRSHIVDGHASRNLPGMLGTHTVIHGGQYHLNYNHFMLKLADYRKHVVPRFQRYIECKKELVERAREEMRLEEFRPRVLTSFVRNRLIDEVYLPLVGDNLAKQMGVVGEAKRTDLMGLLLLVSPPGYGKTTLMEYIANRLGIIFMKINGPAIGHHVTSLDPHEAPNAGAREEVEKLNLSLEMGDNVMIYLDDIQHCNPEFLQKFISLCDAQRKIEGVYKGRTRTYDLRGRKVCVVMAGNPYTESGEKFQIPDMLSNRADIYNLGEIIGETADAFEMSYLENSLTSSPVLNKLASRSQQDVYGIIRMAERDERDGVELEGNYSLEELNEFVGVMKKLMVVRDIILKVNRQYIISAAQSDDYRTEPPFKLQGSYRNMNRIAEKVVSIMNDAELTSLIVSNYENDSQTLTSDNEANMLKFKELMEILTPAEQQRWNSIKRTFGENLRMKGIDADDQFGQVVVQLRSFSDGLDAIRQAMADGVSQLTQAGDRDEQSASQAAALIDQVGQVRGGLDDIGKALTAGVELILEQAEASDSAASTGATIDGEALQSLLERFPVPAAGSFDPAATSNQRVIVQHKVPRVVLDVIKGQFELMQTWLSSLLNAANLQSSDIQSLHKTLDRTLNYYGDLIEDLEQAKTRRPAKKKVTKKKTR